MQKLGYTQFVIQAGDFGAGILRIMAADYPSSVVSVLSNFWITPPNATDLERYQQGLTSADENTTIQNFDGFTNLGSGYRFIMQLQPLQLAIGMTDSPLGNAMWLYNELRQAVQSYIWPVDQIITWTMMYYIQGPYGGMRFYKEALEEVRHLIGSLHTPNYSTTDTYYMVSFSLVLALGRRILTFISRWSSQNFLETPGLARSVHAHCVSFLDDMLTVSISRSTGQDAREMLSSGPSTAVELISQR
jgi:hypothetical protein